MYKYPKTIDNLIQCYKKLPTIGEKTAIRLALATIDLEEDVINIFSKALVDSKSKIKKCIKCNNFTEDDLCDICKDYSRDSSLLCVVDDSKSIVQFERSGAFLGFYYVLNGLISSDNNYDPEALKIEKLLDIINERNVKEVIIAVKPSIEGETTSLYISKILEKKDLKVSRIALGIPLGADMDYVDSLTLELALENRKEINNNQFINKLYFSYYLLVIMCLRNYLLF